MNESYYAGTSYGVSTTSGLTGALAAMGLFFLGFVYGTKYFDDYIIMENI